jgi:hypothetical protein
MFMRLPGDGAWLGYRDVRRLDNKENKRSRPRILELLKNPTRDNQAHWPSNSRGKTPRITLDLRARSTSRRCRWSCCTPETAIGSISGLDDLNAFATPSVLKFISRSVPDLNSLIRRAAAPTR